MIALCIEASHQKGMGHFFRTLEFYRFLTSKSFPAIICINEHEKSIQLLKAFKFNFEIVDYSDISSNWETELARKYKIKFWFNDRLETDENHGYNVKKMVKFLINLDDFGSGAKYSDLNIFGLSFEFSPKMKSKKILYGSKYLILNREIEDYKRLRKSTVEKILISMGGSDTYGVTVKIVELLKRKNIQADILIGPSFKHTRELNEVLINGYCLYKNVPSMIQFFSQYDLAITGGGITPFEANASGLPCIIIANEVHEIKNAKYLETIGSSIFAGYHKQIDSSVISKNLRLDQMSQNGMNCFDTKGCERILIEMLKLDQGVN